MATYSVHEYLSDDKRGRSDESIAFLTTGAALVSPLLVVVVLVYLVLMAFAKAGFGLRFLGRGAVDTYRDLRAPKIPKAIVVEKS